MTNGARADGSTAGRPRTNGAAPDPVAGARRVLDDAGIDAPVRAAGVSGEIAAVTGSSELREPLARVAWKLRALGFQYVALELGNERRIPTRDS